MHIHCLSANATGFAPVAAARDLVDKDGARKTTRIDPALVAMLGKASP